MMFTIILYILAITGLIISRVKNKKKTKMAIRKAWKSFENILPQFLSVLLIIGLALSILDQDTITKLLGSQSGWIGILAASLIGSITLIPGFVAFPLAAALRNNGAGITAIAAFISTLMMVGIVTLPMEIKIFGKKAAIIRNVMAYFFSILVAVIMGVIL